MTDVVDIENAANDNADGVHEVATITVDEFLQFCLVQSQRYVALANSCANEHIPKIQSLAFIGLGATIQNTMLTQAQEFVTAKKAAKENKNGVAK